MIKKNDLEQIEQMIIKKYGESAMLKMSNQEKALKVPFVSTGLLTLDLVCGGGFPQGKITEIYGKEGSGKTSICLQIAAYLQRKKKFRIVYIDAEYALNIQYCESIGIDPKLFYLSHHDSAEQIFNFIVDIAETQLAQVIILDSIASLVTKNDLKCDFSVPPVASLARVLSSSLKRIFPCIEKSNIILILINQLRSNVNSFGFSGEITSGGYAVRHASFLILELKKRELIVKNNEIIGSKIAIKCVKNKLGMPYKNGILECHFGSGFSSIQNILSFAIDLNIVQRKSTWLYYENKPIGQSGKAASFLLENLNILKKILSSILEILKRKHNIELNIGNYL